MSKYSDLVGESLAAALGVQETLGGEVVGDYKQYALVDGWQTQRES